MGNTQDAINRVCDYRGLPKIKKGSRCLVDGKDGVIFGGNHSANFNVKFADTGRVFNCHPEYKMTIFSPKGDILYQSKEA
ncbi:MAG: hypothetical protein KGZ88_20560 [Methylomicrobium sp.]|nr:hypothetical protein [Methylomicrobium sp.]